MPSAAAWGAMRQQRWDGPRISEKTTKRLKFQIPTFLGICLLGFIWTSFHPENKGHESTSASQEQVPVVADPAPSSFEEEEPERSLSATCATLETCQGEWMTKEQQIMRDTLDGQFIIADGDVMLNLRDPYECDDILISSADDSDDEWCIPVVGEGRRRQFREQERKKLANGASAVITDDIFAYKDDKCVKEGRGKVTITGSDDLVVSGSALPEVKPEKMGWMVWYIFCIVYMFAALAIVCDEFFVPALECFVDEFGISMDVAGATFMAAGGSMPELATSLISTFKDSEVGFVAIVGSAVFNVLFVIAVCAIFAKEVLTLTWWPLFRDCVFYIIALLTVALVFGGTSKNEIEWWEALLLLFEYIMYCTFMKFNSRIHLWVERKLSKKGKVDDEASDMVEEFEGDADKRINPNFVKPSTIRTGIVSLLTKNTYLYETAGVAAVTQIRGELEETFNKIDKDGDGQLCINEVKDLLNLLGVEKDNTQIQTMIRRISRGAEVITFDAFKRWYISSEVRIEADVRRVFDKFDKDGNNAIDREELKACLQGLGHKPSDDEVEEMMRQLQRGGFDEERRTEVVPMGGNSSPVEPYVTFEQFETWYQNSMFYQQKQEKHVKEEEEDGEGLSLEIPEDASWSALFWWFFTYPLCAMMYSTMPDVRTPKWQRNWKMAVLEFLLSLGWIGFFSLWLYECLVVVSNTLRIPVAVSAVTLLAGGTSVPDLLSSYVVARNGQGDMAVSSSIGSNIFDVTVGLPLPWLLYCIAKGKSFSLGPSGSKGLFFSLLLLVVMLGAVIGTIMCMRWKMTKGLGGCMMLFYFLYVIQYLLQKMPYDCNTYKTGVFQVDF